MTLPETPITTVLTQAASVRACAIAASYNAPYLLPTLSRFVGKALLLLEALAQADVAPPVDILADFSDALTEISEAVASVAHMSRLQALLHAEDTQGVLKAATADLRAAVEALAPLQASLPVDAREDLAALQRQLRALRLAARPAPVAAGVALAQALALDAAGVAIPVPGLPTHRESTASDGSRGSVSAVGLGPALPAALHEAGLSALPPSSWLNDELSALANGVAETQDPVAAFLLCCAAKALLRWAASTALVLESPYSSRSTACDATCQRWNDLVTALDAAHCGGSGSGSPLGSPTEGCFACAMGLAPATLDALVEAFQAIDALQMGEKLTPDDFPALCAALTAGAASGTSRTGPRCASASRTLLRQYQAAVLMGHAAESSAAALAAAGGANALLVTLEGTRHPAVRAAAATALRTMCRDPTARDAAVSAGALRALARQLESPGAAPRRAAARALGNVFLAGEAVKREAVSRYSALQSLVAMVRGDDVLGQEAAAGALTNLAANSEAVQAAMGKTDIFGPLTDLLREGSTPGARHAASRALRNLTSRVHANRLRAVAAGAVDPLVAQLCVPDPAARAAAAAALAHVLDGASEAATQAHAAGAVADLLEMLHDASSPAGRDAAACALLNLTLRQPCASDSDSDSINGSAAVPAPAAARKHSSSSRNCDSPRACEVGLDALPALVTLLSTGSAGGRRAAAKLMAVLGRRHGKTAVVDAGAVAPLVALLNASKMPDPVRRAASSSLCALFHRCDAARRQALAAGALPALVTLLRLRTPEAEGTRQEAARALGGLCANNRFRQGEAAAAAGAVTALLDVLRDCGPGPAEAAAMALGNLACMTSTEGVAAMAGAGTPLLRLLRNGGGEGARRAAARALGNLIAERMPAELEPHTADLAKLLADMASATSDEESQAAAAGALGNLACASAAGASAVARTGGAVALAQLCRSPAPPVREAAAQGLWEACRGSPVAAEAAAAQNVVPWLVQLLLVGEDAAKEAAVGCLAELTRVGETVLAQAEAAGAGRLLALLAREGGEDVAAAAAAALHALERGSPDSPSIERQLSQRLTLLRQAGSRVYDDDSGDAISGSL